MRVVLTVCLLGLLTGCGWFESDEKLAGFATCVPIEVPEGLQFTCTDSEGNVHTGVVRNGEEGAPGEMGPEGKPGRDGVDGRSMVPVSTIVCSGALEGWLEGSSYEVEFIAHVFETEDRFLRSDLRLMRGEELVNRRQASAFVLGGGSYELSDSMLTYDLQGLELGVKSNSGGLEARIDCEVQR